MRLYEANCLVTNNTLHIRLAAYAMISAMAGRFRDAEGIPSGDRASVGEATWAKTVVLVPYARMPQRPHRTPRWSRRPPAYAVLQLLGAAHCER
jgi:hypothetical protein